MGFKGPGARRLLGHCVGSLAFALVISPDVAAQSSAEPAILEEVTATDSYGSVRQVVVARDGDVWPDRLLVTLRPEVEHCACEAHRSQHPVESQVPSSTLDARIAAHGAKLFNLLRHHDLPTLTDKVADARDRRLRAASVNPRRARRASRDDEARRHLDETLLNTYVVHLRPGADPRVVARDFRRDPAVVGVELAAIVRVNDFFSNGQPDDPFYYSENTWEQGATRDLWNIVGVNPVPAWQTELRGAGVIAAIVDTGVDLAHPDLIERFDVAAVEPLDGVDNDGNGFIDDRFRSWDFWNDDPEFPNPKCFNPFTQQNDLAYPCDDGTHGSHVAGIALASSDFSGVVGIAPEATVRSVKIFSAAGQGDPAKAVEGLQYAVDEGADLIGASWGSDERLLDPDEAYAIQLAAKAAYDDGVVMVASAGNDRDSTSFFTPAKLQHVIVVAALTPTGQVTDYSNFGGSVDLAAPGGGTNPTPLCSCESPFGTFLDRCNQAFVLSVKSTTRFDFNFPSFGGGIPDYSGCPRDMDRTVDGLWMLLDGTSMAQPHVLGTAALVLEKKPDLRPYGVEWVLTRSAVDIPPIGVDIWSGWGGLDVGWAVEGPVVLTPLADTFVNKGTPNQNKGGEPYLRVRQPGSNERWAFLRFDLTSIERHQGAMLRLRVNDWYYPYEGIGTLYKIENDSWTEYGTTWNNRPQEVGTLVTRLEDTYFSGFGGADWVEVDVSEHVTPGSVNNFVIRDDVGNAEFRSRESANPPELVVMRCGGCGGACTGATPFVAASSSASTFALALVGALLPKRRRKERGQT